MNKKFASIVGTENVSDSPLDLEAYGFCSSESELKPEMIVWPETTEQTQRLLLFLNQGRTPVVIRGSGASSVNGCIGENATVISFERMNRVLKLDVKNKLIEVESGVRITDLNNSLRTLNLCFPLIPFNSIQTVGGMIALNAITKESHGLGRMNEWVEEAEFVDGTGKSFYTKKKELVVGQEGLSGCITKAKLRIMEIPTLSFDIFYFDQITDLLGQARALKKDREAYFVEFIDKNTAQEIGLDPKHTLLSAYPSLKGKIKTLAYVKKIQEQLNSVHSFIRSKGYYHIQDLCVPLEKAYDLILWCEKHDARIHGHPGLGIFYVYFKKEDKDLLETFRVFIRRIGGSAGSAFGMGTINKAFVTQEKKKELMKLKDEYDYNNLLNHGNIVSYR